MRYSKLSLPAQETLAASYGVLYGARAAHLSLVRRPGQGADSDSPRLHPQPGTESAAPELLKMRFSGNKSAVMNRRSAAGEFPLQYPTREEQRYDRDADRREQ